MRRLLIVEDELLLQRALATYLRRRGFEVVPVASLGAARLALSSGPFDAALLDVGLPDGNGLELLDRIGRSRSIVITASPDPIRTQARGVIHLLRKPIKLQQVARALDAVLAA